MAGAFIRFVGGLIWAIGGALMAFNPPPAGSTVHVLPGVGWAFLAAGVWTVIQAFRVRVPKDTGQLPRHAAATSLFQRIMRGSYLVTAVTAGGYVLWWAIRSPSLSLLGLAIGSLGTTALTLITFARYPALR